MDLYEGKFAIADYADKFFDYIIQKEYYKLGVDLIEWFVYDNDFGRNGLEAYEDDNLICQSFDELYQYIEQYKRV